MPQGEDPIAQLNQQVITIFSCREKAARRAATRIMETNSGIDIRICTDDRLTDQAKAYARNSDIVVVVTACISHALTYGIAPYLKNTPVYPRSSGETGIIEALEEYISQMTFS